jgi:hypothetical protein
MFASLTGNCRDRTRDKVDITARENMRDAAEMVGLVIVHKRVDCKL